MNQALRERNPLTLRSIDMIRVSLTNLAIKEGLSVGGPEYRNFIECDYDYWYERNEKQGFTLNREIDSFLLTNQRCIVLFLQSTTKGG